MRTEGTKAQQGREGERDGKKDTSWKWGPVPASQTKICPRATPSWQGLPPAAERSYWSLRSLSLWPCGAGMLQPQRCYRYKGAAGAVGCCAPLLLSPSFSPLLPLSSHHLPLVLLLFPLFGWDWLSHTLWETTNGCSLIPSQSPIPQSLSSTLRNKEKQTPVLQPRDPVSSSLFSSFLPTWSLSCHLPRVGGALLGPWPGFGPLPTLILLNPLATGLLPPWVLPPGSEPPV